jgi:hypothetical protein
MMNKISNSAWLGVIHRRYGVVDKGLVFDAWQEQAVIFSPPYLDKLYPPSWVYIGSSVTR